MHFFQNGSPGADLEIWHASCQTSRHLTKCRKEWRDVDVHDWQTACHGRLKKKKRNENYSRLVPAGQILVWRQVEKNALAVDYISRGVNLKADILFLCLLAGKLIHAEGKTQPFAATFSKHIIEATFAVSNHWPLTLAMTFPAAPRMSDELRVWCLPMTTFSTRTRSDRRSCTTCWRCSRFSAREEEDTRRLSLDTVTTPTKKNNFILKVAIANSDLLESQQIAAVWHANQLVTWTLVNHCGTRSVLSASGASRWKDKHSWVWVTVTQLSQPDETSLFLKAKSDTVYRKKCGTPHTFSPLLRHAGCWGLKWILVLHLWVRLITRHLSQRHHVYRQRLLIGRLC